jgi:hypothetical protein
VDALLDALVAVAFLAVLAGALWWWLHHRKRTREGFERLLERDGLHRTEQPCGLGRRELAGRFAATPDGARRNGIRHGVQGPADVTLGGHQVRAEIACFQWWYEDRTDTEDGPTYSERRTTVAVARLPVVVPGRVQLRPEGVLGRMGVRRRDQQLESDTFNRRFRVEGSDPTLTLNLLDASMQHRLLETAVGRTLHLEGDLVVLGGSPATRDPELPGVIGELPAAARELRELLEAVPTAFWRGARPVAERPEPV